MLLIKDGKFGGRRYRMTDSSCLLVGEKYSKIFPTHPCSFPCQLQPIDILHQMEHISEGICFLYLMIQYDRDKSENVTHYRAMKFIPYVIYVKQFPISLISSKRMSTYFLFNVRTKNKVACFLIINNFVWLI